MENKSENKPLRGRKFMKLFENSTFVGVLLGVIAFAIYATLFHFNVLYSVELMTLKSRFDFSRSEPSDNCVVLAISAESRRELGKWPWPREYHATIIEALNYYGAKVIAFDLFFSGEDLRLPESDNQLVKKVNKYKNVILGSNIYYSKSPPAYDDQAQVKLKDLSFSHVEDLRAIFAKNILNTVENVEDEQNRSYINVPFKELLKVTSAIGLCVSATKAKDAVIVDWPLIIQTEVPEYKYPALALMTYIKAFNIKEIKQLSDYLQVGNAKIPVSDNNTYLINWYKPQKKHGGSMYRQIPFYAIYGAYKTLEEVSNGLNISIEEAEKLINDYINDKTDNYPKEFVNFIDNMDELIVYDEDSLEDKIVFVGLTDQSAGTQDLISTPVAENVPGVFLHATMLDNFIQQDFIKKLPNVSILFVMLFLSIATGITLLGMKNPKYGIGISFIYMLYFIIPFILFVYFKVYTDIIYTELSIVTVFVFGLGYQWFVVDKDKRQLRRVFSNYLAPQILTEVLKDPDRAALGGNKKEITVLFSDIRGFTTLSESRSPEEVVQFLNEFFNAMVEEIMKNEGTVDKFIGDAIMAFWGAPVEHKDHAELAVKGALAMADRLESLKQKWIEEGKNYPEVNIGIGLNTGEALVGHVGAEKIKSYTVIGDTVNLASRLEGLNKKYDIPEEKSIIISEYTYQHVKDKYNTRYLGIDHVKGKIQEVPIYKVIGTKED